MQERVEHRYPVLFFFLSSPGDSNVHTSLETPNPLQLLRDLEKLKMQTGNP